MAETIPSTGLVHDSPVGASRRARPVLLQQSLSKSLGMCFSRFALC